VDAEQGMWLHSYVPAERWNTDFAADHHARDEACGFRRIINDSGIPVESTRSQNISVTCRPRRRFPAWKRQRQALSIASSVTISKDEPAKIARSGDPETADETTICRIGRPVHQRYDCPVSTAPAETVLQRLVAPSHRRCGAPVTPSHGPCGAPVTPSHGP
jgi:hypothetical protein